MAAVLFNNGEKGIRPLLPRSSNRWLLQMDAVRQATPENAWIATGDDIGKVYLPYFAYRKPLILRERSLAEPATPGGPPGEGLPAVALLRANRPEVFELKEPVYLLSHVMENPRWKGFLETRFQMEEVPAGEFLLFRLKFKRQEG